MTADAGFEPSPERYPMPVVLAGDAYLAIGDADSDGRSECVLSPSGCGSRLLLQRDDGTFAPAPVVDAAGGPLIFADMDRDGRDDLVGLVRTRSAS